MQLRIRALTYREADHSLKVGVEPLKGDAGWIVYLDSIGSWQPPFANDALSPERLATIRINIVRALDAMGITYSATGLPSGAMSM